jgi:hypothetical protein
MILSLITARPVGPAASYQALPPHNLFAAVPAVYLFHSSANLHLPVRYSVVKDQHFRRFIQAAQAEAYATLSTLNDTLSYFIR